MKRRLQLSLLAFVATLVTMFGLAPFVFTVTSLGLLVVWVGIPFLIGAVALLRLFARPFRHWAGWARGRPIVAPYRAFAGGGLIARVRWILTDRATWRELVWSLVNAIAGFVLALLSTVFLLAAAFYLVYPLLMFVTPPEIFSTPFGFFTLRSWTQGFFLWPVAALMFAIWWGTTPGLMTAWTAIQSSLLGPTEAAVLAGRVAALTESRADTRDSAAAEIRRIERDLHDGVQVRLVSLGMSLGMAEELIETDPARARALLSEAVGATTGTLDELRTLVRGIHPPVLADRGLVGAVRALAVDMPLPTTVAVEGFGAGESTRLPAPVEACAYFVVAEALANVIKHAAADRASVDLELTRREIGPARLRVMITDDGMGGADQSAGSGLAGLARRVAAFDGILAVTSPAGGPTVITVEIDLELPCAPSSPKTTPSSARA